MTGSANPPINIVFVGVGSVEFTRQTGRGDRRRPGRDALPPALRTSLRP